MSIAGPRGAPKRSPTVLVTDAREVKPKRPQSQRQGTRVISVDHVLQYSSDIPSAQRRLGPGERPSVHLRTPSGRHPLDPKLSGRGVPLAATHFPSRSSKVSEKLVLLPETTEEHADGFEEEDDEAAPSDEDLLRRKRQASLGGKSVAERLHKSQRIADPQLARVTAYCTAQSYKLRSFAAFVRDQHAARTKLYDDCLYCVYQLPLLGGVDGYRVRSSPVVKNPGGKSVLDEQIEANERREYREGWREESSEYSVYGNEGYNDEQQDQEDAQRSDHDRIHDDYDEQRQDSAHEQHEDGDGHRRQSNDSGTPSFPSPYSTISPDAYTVAELFIFSHGTAVFWNFTANQEKDLLADLTFSSTDRQASFSSKTPSPTALVPTPLMTRPLDESDFETEEFHFQYDNNIEKPRIYNDMITMRTSDHMVKLAISHAIAQSTKLSYFEERMQRTMADAQYVPRKLALEGRLGMDRAEVVSLVGRLFEGRVDVNLSSNMLDTPNFFWDSEPTLYPLYQAVREYLEIKPRVLVLNERCKVFLDLAEILSDSIADAKMTRITLIIIVLIVVSILVTCTEVFLRFAILAGDKAKDNPGGVVGGINGTSVQLLAIGMGSES